jgi:hypothetical protein
VIFGIGVAVTGTCFDIHRTTSKEKKTMNAITF